MIGITFWKYPASNVCLQKISKTLHHNFVYRKTVLKVRVITQILRFSDH